VKCDFADSLLQSYFDGELNDRRAAELLDHLYHNMIFAYLIFAGDNQQVKGGVKFFAIFLLY